VAPLTSEGEPFGLILLPPLYGGKEKLREDLRFLTVLSALLSPMVKKYYLKEEDSKSKQSKTKPRTSLLEEILAERLNEVLNKIDPYVEANNRIGLLDEIIGYVEKMMIQSALKRVDFVQTAAAQLLGINRNTLRAKMKRYKIKAP
jgi:Fis family transcriptional regulator